MLALLLQLDNKYLQSYVIPSTSLKNWFLCIILRSFKVNFNLKSFKVYYLQYPFQGTMATTGYFFHHNNANQDKQRQSPPADQYLPPPEIKGNAAIRRQPAVNVGRQ